MEIPKVWVVALCIVGLLVGLASGTVIVQNLYKLPQTGTLASDMSVTIKINSAAWTNGTAVDWGALKAGQTFTKTVDITNVGTIQINSITLTNEGLPSNWTETLSTLTGPLNPTLVASGTLTLIVPANATAGSFTWNSYIITS